MDGSLEKGFEKRPEREPATLAERFDEIVCKVDELRSSPAVIAATVSLVLALSVGAWWLNRPSEPNDVAALIPQVQLQTTEVAVGPPASVVVHVSGAVLNPGVYVLLDNSRVVDAVESAGGAETGADLHQLNLAAVVSDGMQIRVPVEGEVVASPFVSEESVRGPVDLNRADASRLESLSGVGPSTAAAIIRFRDENGPFPDVDALLDVPGIGPAKLAGLIDEVVVR